MDRERWRIVSVGLVWWSGGFMVAGLYQDDLNKAAMLCGIAALLALVSLACWPKEREEFWAPVKTIFNRWGGDGH